MLTNMNIVLTGASSGIGYESLKLLARGKGNKILAVALETDNLVGKSKKIIPFTCDISSAEGVDAVFKKAEEVFNGEKIDMFFANAGFPYYEVYNYTDWERVKKIFDTNSISPMYTYTKYINHLKGRNGILAYTVSAIGQMAMPGYALYSASKFALHGFQQAIRLEKPKNLQLTCLYPVATNTNFFKVANEIDFEKPFPVQEPDDVAKAMISGIEKGRDYIYPSNLFVLAKMLMTVIPPVRSIYWGLEAKKLERFKRNLAMTNKKARELWDKTIEKGLNEVQNLEIVKHIKEELKPEE